MVIQIRLYKLHDNPEVKTYRNVKPLDYGAYVAGFFANRDNYKGGEMIQLKGGERIRRHTFGDINE